MAVHGDGTDISMRAAGDFSSTGQFRFVNVDANGRGTLAGAAARVRGVGQNKPGASDRGYTVRIDGESKLYVIGTVAPGDYIVSLANGIGSAAGTVNGTEIGAIALEAHTGASTTAIAVQVKSFGRVVTA